MKNILFLLLVPVTLNAYDIVQVDTGLLPGTKPSFEGPREALHPHGTMMAEAADKQAVIEKLSLRNYQSGCIFSQKQGTCTEEVMALILAETLAPRVISISLQGRYSIPQESLVIKRVQSRGILVVAAAGNDRGLSASYPAAYGGSCMLSVGTTIKGVRAPYSNLGEIWLEQVGDEQGTSFSTARMAVIAVKYMNKGMKCSEVKKILVSKYGLRKNIQTNVRNSGHTRETRPAAKSGGVPTK